MLLFHTHLYINANISVYIHIICLKNHIHTHIYTARCAHKHNYTYTYISWTRLLTLVLSLGKSFSFVYIIRRSTSISFYESNNLHNYEKYSLVFQKTQVIFSEKKVNFKTKPKRENSSTLYDFLQYDIKNYHLGCNAVGVDEH